MLPEEEPTAEDVPSPPPMTDLRLAPTHYPTQQAHSFESYLLPDDSQPNTNVRRQMSDPTPSPEIHPISRRSSRSTCRPLQIQSIIKQDKSGENYFKFPEVVQLKDTVQTDNSGDKTSLVKFINDNKLKAEDQDYLQRVKSPTYGILQNTVSQLITISQDYTEVECYISVENETNGARTHQTLVIPSNGTGGNSPYKTPTENSAFSSPGFYTPQSDVSDLVKKSSAETLTSSNSSSSSFQTPSNTSPDIASSVGDVNRSVTTMSYKTALDGSRSSTVINSPLLSSADNRRQSMSATSAEDVAQTTLVMDVDSLDKRNSTLYVKPIKTEQENYNNNTKLDRNRTMLSILIDSPRDQKQHHFKTKRDLDLNENNTSLVLKEATTAAVPGLVSPNEGNTTSSPTSVSTGSSLSPEPGAGGNALSRVPSRRKLTRSLARVSSQTVFELVGPR